MATAIRSTRSTCCYCGTGCGVVIESQGSEITAVKGDAAHPANFGKLCTKGTTLALTMQPAAMSGRARACEVRQTRNDTRHRADWDSTLDLVATRIADTVVRHGPDSIGIYVSGQLLTEDYYVFNKLAKGLIGTANIDTNSRLCMSSAVTGYQATLGVDAPPCSYEDIDHASCFFIAGSNAAYAHPILFRRIEAAKDANPELKIIVVDPRVTETAAFADLHLQILPGTDVALFHAMLHAMLWEEWIDRAYIEAHTEGFEALRTLVREMSPAVAAEICGVKADDIVTAARWFATSTATLSLYCQGLNQSASGTAKNATLINLHLATAQIGKPGAGPFSLTGQPNAMGGREVGGLATTLAAHRDLANPVDREEVRAFWGVDRVPETRGKTAVEMFEAARKGDIKLLWIVCTNPVQSLPDLSNIAAALETAEFVVLQDAYRNTETAAYADVLLPATSWGEKDGTVTNSERRISRVRAAVPAPGEGRHDWEIAAEVGRRIEAHLKVAAHETTRQDRPTLFPWATPEDVWNEHRALTRGRDLDITGLSYATLERDGPQQWPYPAGATEGAARLYTDGVFHTPSGRARFHAVKYQPVADKVDAHYPFSLTTGRLRDQWHGMSRTGSVARLFGHTPEPAVEMNPHDLARRHLKAGDLVEVKSRRGALVAPVHPATGLRAGQVYLAMHWGKRFLGGAASFGVNTLTNPAFDATSRQPELKHAAVRIAPAALSWHLTAFCLSAEAQARHDALMPLQREVAFMSTVLIGRERPGVLVRVAHHGKPTDEWLSALETIMMLDGQDVLPVELLRYDDARRAASRCIRVVDGQLQAVRLSGDATVAASAEWLREWLIGGKPVAAIRRLLLSPIATAPEGTAPPSHTVCQCLGVSETAIAAALATGASLASVQATLGCGTECGSCLPELRRMAACAPVGVAA